MRLARWLILQKARRHGTKVRSDSLRARGFRYCFTPLPGCFSPFPRGTGALSVTGRCSGLEGGPPCFPPGSTCPAVLWTTDREGEGLRLRGCNPVPPAFPCRSAARPLCHSRGGLGAPLRRVPQPRRRGAPKARCARRFGRRPVSLAATPGIPFGFSSSGYLDVSVPPVPPPEPMRSARARCGSAASGSPVRTPADHSPCAAPRGFSQLGASFAGPLCQGIHRAPWISSPGAFAPRRSLNSKVDCDAYSRIALRSIAN